MSVIGIRVSSIYPLWYIKLDQQVFMRVSKCLSQTESIANTHCHSIQLVNIFLRAYTDPVL